MRRTFSSWTTTFARLGFRRKKRRSGWKGRSSRMEVLEDRQMLATVAVNSFSVVPGVSGQFRVNYTIVGTDMAPFNLSVLRSTDGAVFESAMSAIPMSGLTWQMERATRISISTCRIHCRTISFMRKQTSPMAPL